jgi:hypothetical protein
VVFYAGYADQYEPAVRDMLSNISTCPTEQLLFFHNLAWSHPMELSNGTTVPLIDYIAVTRCDALLLLLLLRRRLSRDNDNEKPTVAATYCYCVSSTKDYPLIGLVIWERITSNFDSGEAFFPISIEKRR